MIYTLRYMKSGGEKWQNVVNRYFLISCLVFLRFANVNGQDIKFTAITSHEGLSSNTINSILKDRCGYLWFATLEGVDRFNGKDTKTYHFNTGRGPVFQSNEVDALYEDHSGNLWVGTMGGGLYRYDRLSDQFRPYPGIKDSTYLNNLKIRAICGDHSGRLWLGTISGLTVIDTKANQSVKYMPDDTKPGALRSGNILSLFEDSRKRMWIGTDKGLYVYDSIHHNFISYFHDNKNSESLCSDQIRAIAESSDGYLWVGTSNGLSRFSQDMKKVRNFGFSPTDNNTLSGNLIYSIAVDNDKIWIGTEGGLNIIDSKTAQIRRFNHDGRNKFSMNSKSIRYVFIDPAGIYWLGTYSGGIYKYDRNLTLFNLKEHNEYDAYGLSSPAVTSFTERKDGDIYIGTDGGGLNLFHLKSGLFTHVDLKTKQKANTSDLPIMSMILDRRQRLWIGTFQNGLFIVDVNTGKYKQLRAADGVNNINQNDIFCFKEDNLGRIWIGTNGKGIDIFDPVTSTFTKMEPGTGSNKLPVNGFIRVIEQDHNKNMWIGTYGTGLAVLNPATLKYTVFNYANTGLPIDRVFSLLEDRYGNFWIGTGGDGLYYYDIKKKKFLTYSVHDGLPDGTIHKILEDNNGNIWLSTNKGLCSFDIKLKKFTCYSHNNGLQKEPFLNGSGLKSSQGLIYFGGGGGFNYIDPVTEIKKNKTAPVVLLTALKVNNKEVTAGKDAPIKEDISIAKQITINYKQDFSIDYAAINFTLSQQNSYAYKLKGFNKDWNYVGNNTTAYYTNLDPGTYKFMVKASNNDGVWNDKGAGIEIIVLPPLWMTWYAFTFYIIIALATLLFIRRLGIKKVERKILLNQERREAEQLHQLDLMKIKFLTNLSHEFRTPISLIMAPAEKLLGEQNDHRTSSQLAVIKRNARRLLNLVNQLLDFRKMEEHELKLTPMQGEIISFIKDIIDSFQDLSENKNIELVYKGQDKTLFVWFDHNKVERILFNLLSNSFKFTPPGGTVTVEVSKTEEMDPSKDVLLTISVADTGIGISEENVGPIFQRFFRVDDLSAGLNEGSGIGLSITKEFVELHGGNISVSSKHGYGSVFTIVLPLKTFESHSIEADVSLYPVLEQNDDSIKTLENDLPNANKVDMLKVLIIEDNDELRFYIRENLKKYYKIYEASDGKEGWDKVLSFHPDLVVSDISMPYMDGIQLSKKIKGDKRTGHIPIILLTAFTGEEEQLKGLETGANDYLTKPFNFEILNIKIRNLLLLNTSFKNTYTKQLKVLPADVEIESSSEKLLNKAITCLEKNINNPEFSVVDLSNQLGMSRGALYAKLFELTGKPPVEFIRSFRLDRAAFLLQKSDMTVSQIAYEVGFATPHYFSRSFKNKFNVLPSEYRKNDVSEVTQ